MKFISFVILITVTLNMEAQNIKFDWQGHRGCRGILPENSIPSFLKALELPIKTLELDVVMSKDNDLIVSHEAWMSEEICSKPDGTPVLEKESKQFNLYEMTTAEIQRFDSGKRGHPRFKEQTPMPVFKPTLRQVVEAVNEYCKIHNKPMPFFNIELKSEPESYDKYIPKPEVFVPLAIAYIKQLGVTFNYNLQSFDINVLEMIKKTDPTIRISYLVENTNSIEDNLAKLSFKPDIYSPYYILLSKKRVKYLHSLFIEVIPWTVNSPKDMQRLMKWKVDGIITDYPNYIIF